jgi:D-glycero-alpha-D-manno-heptose-7-phosphate kinase|tara:strand:+ start:159 stop:1124 length:966 start_codon:yes stop_codon:yes gene_type:complete
MIISQTPLRVSFLGGNTDLRNYFLNYGGLVLSTTIDKYIYCIVKKRFDNLIYINYSIKEVVKNVDDIKHELVREALRLTGITGGIEITFLSDIPTEGSGLGSSSTVTVGLLNALHTYLGSTVSSDVLAQEAIKIELDILKKPIGIQDQYAVAMGGLKAYDFLQSGAVTGNGIVISESVKEDFNNSLMLLYTGITRSADDVLSSFNVENNIPLLGQNKQFTIDGIDALLREDLRKFGLLLHTYWQVKKQLSDKVSNLEIDAMYSQALRAGAIGGKVIGAGGGGFLLIMFPANKRAKIREALKEYRELPFRFSELGSRIIFNV